MDYSALSETKILNFEQRKVALFEEVKKLFIDSPHLIELWYQDAYFTPATEKNQVVPGQEVSESFRSLYYLIFEDLSDYKRFTKRIVRNLIDNFEDTIKEHIASYLAESTQQSNDLTINEQKYIYTNTSTPFHLMRNIVTNKKHFKENEAGVLGSELIDNKGTLHGLAELRPAPLFQIETEFNPEFGLDLLETTLSSLDELTADIFDLVSYMWMTGNRDDEGFIEFHSDDALMLRQYQHDKNEHTQDKIKFRERDRFSIMRRVAALSSVWVALDDGPEKIKIVNAQDIEAAKLYKFKNFKRMFDVGSVRIAFDKKTNQAKGIYALQIKPSSILQPYLDGTKSTFGALDLKVFTYNYVTQREHKRLTRYLSRQWKIRSIQGSIHQPFKISTLLRELDFPSRLNGVQIRDRFEEVLDDLQKDEVIGHWAYTESIDENRVGKRGWFQNYWSQLSISITPPSTVLFENKKRFPLPSAIIEPSTPIQDAEYHVVEEDFQDILVNQDGQTELLFDVSIDKLSPEIMKAKIHELGYSIRKAANEIGISHTTLSRYLTGKIKRHNKQNDQKMLMWLDLNK